MEIRTDEENNGPPKWAIGFLGWFCPSALYETIEGDLLEQFEIDIKAVGRKKARNRFIWNAIRFFHPGIITRNKFSIPLNQSDMIRTYLKTGLRSLLKRKVYSFINIAGLSIGIAVCLVIWKYVEFESSYDRFHTNAAHIYRVTSSLYTDGQKTPYLGYDVGPALAADMPEIKSFVRTHGASETMVTHALPNGQVTRFEETRLLIVDSTFLNIFSHDVVKGEKQNALTKPYSIVVTESMARKYFGENADPIGQVLSLKGGWNKGDYTVTAVIKDVPANSTIPFDFLLSIYDLLHGEFYSNRNARWDNFFTYVELYPPSNLRQLEKKTSAFIKKYRGNDKNINADPSLKFQPLVDMHYSPDLNREGSYRTTIYFYILISVFIILIAWINYINLATARATERSKEVGIKKAIGVSGKQLVAQFLTESFLVNLLSIILALGLAIWLLPILGGIVQKELSFDFRQHALWYLMAGLLLIGSFVSGIYPAFVLSSFKTTDVVKGGILKVRSGLSFRKALVVFQFTASLLLITGTFVIYSQIRFMQTGEMGMNMSHMLIVRGPRMMEGKDIESRLITFKNQLKNLSFINHVSSSHTIPGGSVAMNILMRKGGVKDSDGKMGDATWVDPDFVETYGIQIISGKTWNSSTLADSVMRTVMINETAVSMLGFGTPNQAINETIIIGQETARIGGVLKDFHWNSLKEKQAPMVFYCSPILGRLFSVQLNGNNLTEDVQNIKKQFEAAFPGDPFEYYFQDEFFNRQYAEEQQFEKIFILFSGLAVFIACLGLWGLTSFTTLQRRKEISIRKVLGASVTNVISMLSWQYLKLVLVAGAVAFPVTFMVAPTWLKNFAFHIDLSPALVFLPFFVLSIVAFTTIATQVFRAARANPVDHLKYE